MSEKISLPSGGWVVLRNPAAVPVKLRRPVEKALLKLGQSQAKSTLASAPELSDAQKAAEVASTINPEILDQFNDLNDLLIVARTESWSFDFPIAIESLGEFGQGDYEALQEVAAKDVTEMMPRFGISNDPNSPIKPSDA
jgi:hypothetical protein